MRLLNTSTLVLHDFFEPYPDYVILSHMWGDEEVSYDDIHLPHARQMRGSRKIAGCCRIALRDGFDWAWIDTCCIDKRSSSELSEAINSMYEWYWSASICYAYLSDVREHRDSATTREEFETSRWHTRGWCLQELLAPDVVEFYDEAWKFLGTKAKLMHHISDVTGINGRYLLDRDAIRSASIATKFSWAAVRQTTRAEDMAYCLLGLLDINMPMLYGEGERAFYRLQSELIARYNDHTIFTWEAIEGSPDSMVVLAPSPAYFKQSAGNYNIEAEARSTHEITNHGLRITLPCIHINQERLIAILNCRNEQGSRIGMWLENLGKGRFRRLSNFNLARLTNSDLAEAETQVLYLDDYERRKRSKTTIDKSAVVRHILADATCRVHVVHKGFYASGFRGIIQTTNEKADHQLEELVLHEGDIVSIALKYGEPEQPNRFTFFAGICFSQGRVLVSIENDQIAFEDLIKQWSEWIQTGEFTSGRVLGDYNVMGVRKKGSPTIIAHAETKKQRRFPQMRWETNIRIFECDCGRLGSTEGDKPTTEQLCICKWRDKRLRSSECAGRNTWDVWTRYSGCCCEYCTEEPLIDDASGLHFVECPCWDCQKESKIMLEDTIDLEDTQPRNTSWSRRLLRLRPRRRQSTEF